MIIGHFGLQKSAQTKDIHNNFCELILKATALSLA
jgi:hypothetical protein